MISQELSKLNHCVYNLEYHLVLITKYRRKCVHKAILVRLQEHFKRLLAAWKCQLIEFNGEPDHGPLLISLNPTVQPFQASEQP